jgi:integrase
LESAATYIGPAWTDDGANRDYRGLKHRGEDAVRVVPVSPALAAILRHHLSAFEPGPEGRAFSSHYGQIISPRTCQKVFRQARTAAFTKAEAASPLASRIYDLRHACLTRWLNAGVPAPDVAQWAGNSVEVLHRHYYNCVAGQLADNQQRITAAERHGPTSSAFRAENV